MASKPSIRSLQALSRRSRRCCVCANTTKHVTPVRQFSSTSSRLEEGYESKSMERPRWTYTPEQMKAPFHPRLKDPSKAYEVNEDPAKLDAMYVKLLGRGGDQVLTEEIKWLAVTHKSFDQGRRGFNDRLALFGKQILLVQTNLALLHSPSGSATPIPDPYGRTPYSHPALNGLPNLSTVSVSDVLAKERLGRLAASCGIPQVTRWKPRNPANLESSGCDVVYAASLYAILGAIALQRGGEKANQVAREAILKRLGIE
ncbi:MAG: hypothetical protein M1818_002352 [Claussenomyces sp. TS43310]|nr:MAG: hypothetical protein M1818_002352 [Claussenomyces sp. TS43310]